MCHGNSTTRLRFIRVEGRLFGDVPMEIDLKLSVEDSPNSAGVAIDAIRCCKLRSIAASAACCFRLRPIFPSIRPCK